MANITSHRNQQLFFIKMHWSYSKYKFLLHMLIEYKIPAKEHQVDYSWAADAVSALETLFWKYLEYVP